MYIRYKIRNRRYISYLLAKTSMRSGKPQCFNNVSTFPSIGKKLREKRKNRKKLTRLDLSLADLSSVRRVSAQVLSPVFSVAVSEPRTAERSTRMKSNTAHGGKKTECSTFFTLTQ